MLMIGWENLKFFSPSSVGAIVYKFYQFFVSVKLKFSGIGSVEVNVIYCCGTRMWQNLRYKKSKLQLSTDAARVLPLTILFRTISNVSVKIGLLWLRKYSYAKSIPKGFVTFNSSPHPAYFKEQKICNKKRNVTSFGAKNYSVGSDQETWFVRGAYTLTHVKTLLLLECGAVSVTTRSLGRWHLKTKIRHDNRAHKIIRRIRTHYWSGCRGCARRAWSVKNG